MYKLGATYKRHNKHNYQEHHSYKSAVNFIKTFTLVTNNLRPRYCTPMQTLKPGSHLCDKHKHKHKHKLV